MMAMAGVDPDEAQRNFCRWIVKSGMEVSDMCLPFAGYWLYVIGGLLVIGALILGVMKFNWRMSFYRKTDDTPPGGRRSLPAKRNTKKSEPRCDRVELVEIIQKAKDAGWRIHGDDRQVLELLHGLRQAGVDGTIQYWGRFCEYSSSIESNTTLPLVKIPADHWEDYQIDLVPVMQETENNRRNRTTRSLVNESGYNLSYNDLHCNLTQAVDWLENNAMPQAGVG